MMAASSSCCRCALLVHMTTTGSAPPPSSNSSINNPTSSFKNFFNLPTTTVLSSSSSMQNVSSLPPKITAPKTIDVGIPVKLLNTFVDLMFEFVDDEPHLPSRSNFAPVEEMLEPVEVFPTEGGIPDDFPEGVYIRNGANPLYGGNKSAVSVLGKTSCVWVEGEGMLHAVYFKKDGGAAGNWTATYNNRYVETSTYLMEKGRNKPCILPAAEGNPAAVLASFLLNSLRLGIPNKKYSNTNVFEHGGTFYSVAETHLPQKIDIKTLETLGDWSIDGAWTRPFTSHPKKAPGTGELVIMGCNAKKPYFEVGIISADGTKLVHRADLKFDRTVISHDIGVTQRFNVILNFPIIVDVNRLMNGGSLIKYEKEKYSKIGVMPRYGDADSVQWFPVEPSCAFHLINCFENGDDEVVVVACKAKESFIPGPDLGVNKFEWFSRGLKNVHNSGDENGETTDQDGMLFSRVYEWRLNTKTGEVKEGYLTGTEFAMDFPMINPHYTGLKNKYAYTQVVDSAASSVSGIVKYGGLAKLYQEERHSEVTNIDGKGEELMKVEYHMFPANTYCSGASFVSKSATAEEDDGWIIAFVHNEDTNTSQVYIVDAKQFSGEAVAKIALPRRVPYGFHGMFAECSF